MTPFTYRVTEEEENIRIDRLIRSVLHHHASRSKIQQWIENGYITVNGKQVKPNYKPTANDEIVLNLPEEKPFQLKKENIPLHIVYEDDDFIVLNKPKGMVVHPTNEHQSNTLVNALLHYTDELSQIGGVERPGIVHRLDKDTSGILVVAKNDVAHQSLVEQFKRHEVERTYEAIVFGRLPYKRGIIDAPIGRDPKVRINMAVHPFGKKAVTHFHVLQFFDQYTHVSLSLETGRTHQIRVHMKHLGHPIVGDVKYAKDRNHPFQGQALFAKRISFHHPRTNERVSFQAEAPEKFQTFLKSLQNNA